METISRSLQQRKRLEVFSRVRWEAMTLVEASILLRLSYRQTKRVWCQYQASGCEGLLHRVRGRLSNRQWRVAACQAVHAWLDMASTERSVSPTSEDVLEGERPMTQVGRKISALDVELILALSSQVKGRVERRNGTLQNRLVKAIRRAGILGIGSANRFLDEQFLPELNGRFTVSGRASESHHRAVMAELDLARALSIQKERAVHNDWTVRWQNRNVRLSCELSEPVQLRQRVTLCRQFDDSLHVLVGEVQPGCSPTRSELQGHDRKIPLGLRRVRAKARNCERIIHRELSRPDHRAPNAPFAIASQRDVLWTRNRGTLLTEYPTVADRISLHSSRG